MSIREALQKIKDIRKQLDPFLENGWRYYTNEEEDMITIFTNERTNESFTVTRYGDIIDSDLDAATIDDAEDMAYIVYQMLNIY